MGLICPRLVYPLQVQSAGPLLPLNGEGGQRALDLGAGKRILNRWSALLGIQASFERGVDGLGGVDLGHDFSASLLTTA